MAEKHGQAENMLVKLENLDQLLTLAGEVIITSSNLDLTYKHLQQLHDHKTPVPRETVDGAKDLAGTSAIISSNLHHLVQAIRTVDLTDLSFRTRRLVRDIARKTGKRVRFEFEGESTTVDKTIVEKLYDPISHQLRNAIDHGIEDTLTRQRAGKPEEGVVSLRASNSENETFIEIEDDGKGVDIQALRHKAVSMGIIAQEDPFTEDDALEIMCMPGVSTTAAVSEVSGRGVGMDVVREQITGMGGIVTFRSTPGKGSLFTFRVPLISAVNILDALVVRSGNYFFAFPINSVVTTISVERKDLHTTLQKGEMIQYLGHLLPLYSLNEVIDKGPLEDTGGLVQVLVVDHKGFSVALKISEFFSPQKLVIIPFNGALAVEGLSGTTILGGRKLGFIIDVPSLIDRAIGKRGVRGLRKTAEPGKKAGAMAAETSAAAETPEGGEYHAAAEPATSAAALAETGEIRVEDAAAATQEFIVEIEKLMPALNESLFALESDTGNADHINKAFRMYHTIKGNFIMIGFAKGGATIHSVESVLDRVRGGKAPMSAEVMDILMDGVAYIEEVVRSSKAGQWTDQPSTAILEASAKILPDEKPQTRRETDVTAEAVQLSHEAWYRANKYKKEMIPTYMAYIEFDAGKQPPFLAACLIYKRFTEIGDVLGTVPPLEDIEKGFMYGKIKVLFASAADAGILEEALVRISTRHYGAQVVKFSRFE
ncbi:MAG: chemotaxis protein CheW [Nitrospinae bacterium]|nr:chemotaxis protein CheW [Nitrospinota bacterium]